MTTNKLQAIAATSMVMFALIIASVPAYAQELQTTTNRPMATDQPAAPATTAPATNRAMTQPVEKTQTERIAERKAALKTKLTAAQQKRIQARCKSAQGKITELNAKSANAQQTRLKVYSEVTTRLNDLQTKVAAQGVDTTALKTQLSELQTKIDTFQTDVKVYSNAVADTAALDCVADPTAFKASLDASRSALIKVREDAVAIRTHLNQNVKPAMVAIKTELAKESGVTDGQ